MSSPKCKVADAGHCHHTSWWVRQRSDQPQQGGASNRNSQRRRQPRSCSPRQRESDLLQIARSSGVRRTYRLVRPSTCSTRSPAAVDVCADEAPYLQNEETGLVSDYHICERALVATVDSLRRNIALRTPRRSRQRSSDGNRAGGIPSEHRSCSGTISEAAAETAAHQSTKH